MCSGLGCSYKSICLEITRNAVQEKRGPGVSLARSFPSPVVEHSLHSISQNYPNPFSYFKSMCSFCEYMSEKGKEEQELKEEWTKAKMREVEEDRLSSQRLLLVSVELQNIL